ncbi:MAG: hypothetical protein ABSE91_04020 [Patescibacteria group bacterium]|jgi:hypothetical protein
MVHDADFGFHTLGRWHRRHRWVAVVLILWIINLGFIETEQGGINLLTHRIDAADHIAGIIRLIIAGIALALTLVGFLHEYRRR